MTVIRQQLTEQIEHAINQLGQTAELLYYLQKNNNTFIKELSLQQQKCLALLHNALMLIESNEPHKINDIRNDLLLVDTYIRLVQRNSLKVPA